MAALATPDNLLSDLISGMETVAITWQLAAIAACLAGAWLVLRLVKPYLTAARASAGADDGARRMGYGGMSIVLYPLAAWVLLLIARWVLHFHHPVHLMKVAIALASSLVIIRIAVYVLRHALPPSAWLRGSERAIAWVIWIGAMLHITGLLPELRGWLNDMRLPLGKHDITLLNVIEGTLSVGITILVALWIGRLLERRVMDLRGLDANMRVVLSKLLKMIFLVLAVLIALPLVGIDVTVLSVFGGAVGVGLGFGLQKIAANYISGFAILLDRSIKLGDLVTIDGRYGEVTRLMARYVVVRGFDGTEAIIPNESVITSTVINHSYSDTLAQIVIPVQVAYASDLPVALETLRAAADNNDRVLKEPAPVAVLKNFGESGVDLELIVWIGDPERGRAILRSELGLAIIAAFREQGIEIPYPQREVRVLDPAPPRSPDTNIG